MADVLGIKAQDNRQLFEVLADQDLLLVPDNCEHLLGAYAQLTDALLRRCRRVQVLATSREPLGVDGERVFRVPSLSPPEHVEAVSDLAGSEAVNLLIERAQAHTSGFALSEETAPLAAAVCRRLDRMPLAIELAAARLASMSLSHLLDRLEHRFAVLIGGSRTALPRQQTLAATMGWSYDLLNPEEQALLCRLSVFAGSFDLEAAEAVSSSDDIEPLAVADLIGSPVDKSLVIADPSGSDMRYRLLETIRHYGADRFAETDPSEGDR